MHSYFSMFLPLVRDVHVHLLWQLQFSPKSKDWTFSMIGSVHQGEDYFSFNAPLFPRSDLYVFLSHTTLSCSADVVQLTVSARPDAFEFRLQNPKSETAGVAGRATYKVITHLTGILFVF